MSISSKKNEQNNQKKKDFFILCSIWFLFLECMKKLSIGVTTVVTHSILPFLRIPTSFFLIFILTLAHAFLPSITCFHQPPSLTNTDCTERKTWMWPCNHDGFFLFFCEISKVQWDLNQFLVCIFCLSCFSHCGPDPIARSRTAKTKISHWLVLNEEATFLSQLFLNNWNKTLSSLYIGMFNQESECFSTLAEWWNNICTTRALCCPCVNKY